MFAGMTTAVTTPTVDGVSYVSVCIAIQKFRVLSDAYGRVRRTFNFSTN